MSLNLEEFLANVKRAALEAVMAAKPAAITFGTVESVSPLKISVDQKFTLYANQLILTNAVRDYSVNVTVNHKTEAASGGSGEAAFAAHSHAINGTKKATIHLGLKEGENVMLLRADGGQKYIVWDRVEVPKV